MTKKAFPFIILGIISFLIQLILIKDFINSFYGNEFFIVLIFSVWFTGTATGSFVYKKTGYKKIPSNILYLIISFLLPSILIFSRILKAKIFMYGEAPDLMLSLLLVLLMTFPICLLLGYLFPLLVEETKIEKTYYAYLFENFGFFIAGIIYYFFLVKQNIFISASFVVLLLSLNLFLSKRRYFFITVITAIFLLFFNKEINLLTLKKIYNEQNIVEDYHTYNGNLVITEREKQYNFYYNGRFLYSTENTYSNEIKTHIPLLFAEKINKILIIGNGFGILKELEKYKFDKLVYPEIDPEIFKPLENYFGNEVKNVKIIKQDAFEFINKTDEKFDIIILNLPPPSTLNFNKFYSKEFFIKLKNILTSSGKIISYLPYSEGYLNENLKKLNILLYKTLNQNFEDVLYFPENENIFIASDEKLLKNINEILEKFRTRKIKNLIVDENYINYRLNNTRRIEFEKFINENPQIKENSFYKPEGYIYEILREIDMFYPYISIFYLKLKNNQWILWAIIFAIFLYSKLKIQKPIFFLAIASLNLITIEIIIIYLFQILSGNIHHKISILVSVLMLSISFGNIIFKKLKISILFLQIIMAIYNVLFFIFLEKINSEFILFIKAIIIGILFGLYFSKVADRYKTHQASKIYYWDLLGALMGIFLSGFFLIPFLGIKTTFLFLIILNIFSLI